MILNILLKREIHFPQFLDKKQTKSALSIVIKCRKTNIVRLLLRYYCRCTAKNKDPILWTWSIVPALDVYIFLKESAVYHLVILEVMKENTIRVSR